MITYTYSEVRQNLSTLLDDAKKEGGILIKKKTVLHLWFAQ